jgi:hypothetical protein
MHTHLMGVRSTNPEKRLDNKMPETEEILSEPRLSLEGEVGRKI